MALVVLARDIYPFFQAQESQQVVTNIGCNTISISFGTFQMMMILTAITAQQHTLVLASFSTTSIEYYGTVTMESGGLA